MTEVGGNLRQAAGRIWRIGVEVEKKYAEDGGPLIAAAISFFVVLSFIPLLLLAIWGLGRFLSSEQAFRHVVQYVGDYLPGLANDESLVRYLQDLVNSHSTIGWLGVVGLLWSGSQGFVVLEQAMNVAFRVPERRNFLQIRLLSFGMILLSGGSLALSLAITSAVTTIRGYTLPVLGWKPGEIPFLWSVVTAVVPALLAVLSFTVVYRVVPNTKVRWRSAVIAGLAAGVLWDLAKRAFTYYLARYASYDQIYGPIGGIIGLVFWLYYSSVILVLGAELASVLQNVHPHAEEAKRRRKRHPARKP
jgi:membrane protein